MTAVVAIFDIGKTNKKLFLFDETYQVVFEKNECFPETLDEDGDPCEDLQKLIEFINLSVQEISSRSEFEIHALNFSTYGASVVYLDAEGRILTPLYSYLKKYPETISKKFYAAYGGQEVFSLATASPVLGSLNAGMQIYRIKEEKQEVFRSLQYALHLPQFASYLVTGQFFSDLTSIGCHTSLWDFARGSYHPWVRKEGVEPLLAPLSAPGQTIRVLQHKKYIAAGTGLHDSSAALIPYLKFRDQPFLLISTGTWCISLNPFNNHPLTSRELKQDCLCYLTPEGRSVKASRIFAGYEHGLFVKKLALHFNKPFDYYETIQFDVGLFDKINQLEKNFLLGDPLPTAFSSYEEAYHFFMKGLVEKQYISTQLVLNNSPVGQIFVDGGFCKNDVYMNLLSFQFDDTKIFSATVAHASALGAALAIHDSWNKKNIPEDLIMLKNYSKKNFQ